MRTCIVIVNYRTAALVEAALASIASLRHETPELSVIVVDNASGDGSAQRLAAIAGNWVRVLPLQHNGGFASGNNAAIREAMTGDARPDLFLLLNPDTLVKPGAIAQLEAFMTSHGGVGIAGSSLEDESGVVQPAARRFPSPLAELDAGMRLGVVSRWLRNRRVNMPLATESHACDWVSGAAMMVRCEVFEQVGLLDEEYFLYFEEVDFCRRSKAAGWSVWHVPASRVVHLEGGSTGHTRGAAVHSPWWIASRKRYYVKSHGRVTLLLANLLSSAGRFSFSLRRCVGLASHE